MGNLEGLLGGGYERKAVTTPTLDHEIGLGQEGMGVVDHFGRKPVSAHLLVDNQGIWYSTWDKTSIFSAVHLRFDPPELQSCAIEALKFESSMVDRVANILRCTVDSMCPPLVQASGEVVRASPLAVVHAGPRKYHVHRRSNRCIHPGQLF